MCSIGSSADLCVIEVTKQPSNKTLVRLLSWRQSIFCFRVEDLALAIAQWTECVGHAFYVIGSHPSDCTDDFFKAGPSVIVQDILSSDDAGLFLHNKPIPSSTLAV
jgi:hypothetical protein